MIEKLKLEQFTAFERLEIDFSPGINIFIGENATGKTHILKTVYAACDIIQSKKGFAEKINDVFCPSGGQIGRLVQRTQGSTRGSIEVTRKINGRSIPLRLGLSNHTKSSEQAQISGSPKQWMEQPMRSVFIPVKDMLANATGFRSAVKFHDFRFEEVYTDIIDHAFYPAVKGPADTTRRRLLTILQEAMDGKVITKNEDFFLKNKQGNLEFTLLAEGFRKLGLLWLLIQNERLINGSALFWDEPETNLNPRLLEKVTKILLELHRFGVQIFIATHDYVLLKEFDLAVKKTDSIKYHSLYRDSSSRKLMHAESETFLGLSPNAIDDTFGSLIDRQIKKDMGGLGR